MPFGSFLPGEDDWLQRIMVGGMRTPPFNPNVPQPTPQIKPPSGLLERLSGGLDKLGGGVPLALSLLANSGYSAQPKSFGQILGQSALQAQQMGQESENDKLRREYMQAQIQAMQAPKTRKPIVVAGPDGKPVYIDEQEAIGKSPYLNGGDKLGNYQPGDYTPESWAEFVKTNNPVVLQRYVTPRQEYSPSFQNVERTKPDGSTERGTFNTRTGEYAWSGQVVPAGTKKRVEAQGAAEGEAAGGQAGKAPAAASMDYVLKRFDAVLPKTTQGGVGGISGRIGTITDFENAQEFDNLREQLSTELRTVYRIPGEGTLSDREQAQYGIQLPSRLNTKRVNAGILKDLRERTRLRLSTPVGGGADEDSPKRVTKSVGGKNYVQIDGQWYEDDGT
jgi:hypothetical protein